MTQTNELSYIDLGSRSHPLPDARPIEEPDAFFRAREILQVGSDLTIDQFHELDGIFRGVSQAQFVALTQDPLHQAALRRYEALSWWQGSPTFIVVSLLGLIAVAAATLFTVVQ